MRCLILSACVLILIWPVTAQEESLPMALLLVDENTDMPHPQIVYQVDLAGHHSEMLRLENRSTPPLLKGDRLWIASDEVMNLADPSNIETIPLIDYQQVLNEALIIPYQPLSGVRGLELSHSQLFIMSGESDNFLNFYRVENGALIQLTNVITLFPNAVVPYLSASADFIAENPDQTGFLYRARLRDANGTDHNALYFYDFTRVNSQEMPFFGKDPIWSLDGKRLAGSRFEQLPDQAPLYMIWMVDLESGEEIQIAPGCNPQFSPDGVWLAYDGHNNPFWQTYTDCFINGQVEAINLLTGEKILLSDGLGNYVRLLGWLIPSQN